MLAPPAARIARTNYSRAFAFLERFRVDVRDDRLDCDIQVGKGEEHLVARRPQDAPLCDQHSALDPSLTVGRQLQVILTLEHPLLLRLPTPFIRSAGRSSF